MSSKAIRYAHKKNKEGVNILLGRKVKAYWDGEESDKGWYDAVVTDYNKETKMHCLTYDIGTDQASEEWLCLDELIQKKQFKVNKKEPPVDFSNIFFKEIKIKEPIKDKEEEVETGELLLIPPVEEELSEIKEISQEKEVLSSPMPQPSSSPVKVASSSSPKKSTSPSPSPSSEEEEEKSEGISRRKACSSSSKEEKEDIIKGIISPLKEGEKIELGEGDEEFCRVLMEEELPVLEAQLNRVNVKIERIMDICIRQDLDLMSNDGEHEDTMFNLVVGVERLNRKRKSEDYAVDKSVKKQLKENE